MKISTSADKTILKNKKNFVRLKINQLQRLKENLSAWRVVKQHHLTKSYSFPDFKTALAFVNKIAKIAESLQHHPDIYLSYGKVKIKTFDYKSNGLIHMDFILADRIDKVFKKVDKISKLKIDSLA